MQGTAELKGQLVDALSGQPISGAVVRLALVASPPVLPNSTRTDDAGHFVFMQLAAGQYNLSVTLSGVTTSTFGSTERRVTVPVTEGAKIDLGTLQVPSGVAISGQILDEHGIPLAGAKVSAWQLHYLSPGERRLNFSGEATSDATGDYAIPALRAGRYFVAAKASESIAPTFFPGTADATTAAPIVVTADAGATVSIRLLSTPLARVSGKVVNSRGVSSADFFVLLAPVREDGAQIGAVNLTSEVDADGKFTVAKVPPGNYNVEVVSKARLEAIANTGRSAVGIESAEESGSFRVTVDGGNVDDVFVRTGPPTMVSGKVLLDGEPVNAELAARLTLRAVQSTRSGSLSGVMNSSFAAPGPKGEFTILLIQGGRLLRVSGMPAGTLLKRVMLRGVDVTDEGFDVSASAISDVVVELTSKPSVVSGRIVGEDNAPIAGAGSIVFSEDRKRWQLVLTRAIQSARTKADGAFSFAGLPPGNYYVAAVPSLVDGEWAEPANLERLRATAAAFKLGDGEAVTLTVTLKKLDR